MSGYWFNDFTNSTSCIDFLHRKYPDLMTRTVLLFGSGTAPKNLAIDHVLQVPMHPSQGKQRRPFILRTVPEHEFKSLMSTTTRSFIRSKEAQVPQPEQPKVSAKFRPTNGATNPAVTDADASRWHIPSSLSRDGDPFRYGRLYLNSIHDPRVANIFGQLLPDHFLNLSECVVVNEAILKKFKVWDPRLSRTVFIECGSLEKCKDSPTNDAVAIHRRQTAALSLVTKARFLFLPQKYTPEFTRAFGETCFLTTDRDFLKETAHVFAGDTFAGRITKILFDVDAPCVVKKFDPLRRGATSVVNDVASADAAQLAFEGMKHLVPGYESEGHDASSHVLPRESDLQVSTTSAAARKRKGVAVVGSDVPFDTFREMLLGTSSVCDHAEEAFRLSYSSVVSEGSFEAAAEAVIEEEFAAAASEGEAPKTKVEPNQHVAHRGWKRFLPRFIGNTDAWYDLRILQSQKCPQYERYAEIYRSGLPISDVVSVDEAQDSGAKDAEA